MKDDFTLEELDSEKEEAGYSEDEWEEASLLKPKTVALLFLAIIVLAAALCGILWKVTHPGKTDGQSVVQKEQDAESVAGAVGDADGNTDAGADGNADAGTAGNADAGTGAGAVGDADGNTDAGTVAEDDGIADAGTGAGADGNADAGTGAGADGTADAGTAGNADAGTGAGADGTAASDSNRVPTKDGRVIVFTDCDDIVSPKEYVNLRLEPSTSEGNATIHCQLNYGETVHRTGISEDSGWSRVEKDGVVCYVVTSLIYVIE